MIISIVVGSSCACSRLPMFTVWNYSTEDKYYFIQHKIVRFLNRILAHTLLDKAAFDYFCIRCETYLFISESRRFLVPNRFLLNPFDYLHSSKRILDHETEVS